MARAAALAGISGETFLAFWQGREKSKTRGRAALTLPHVEGQVKVGICGPILLLK